MLILNRNMHESIMIGDDIKVTILSSGNKCTCIGIKAPKNISVHREEVYKRIKAEKEKQVR